MLLDALVEYTGTVVFVSHDRYFIDKLATRVFEVGDGKVEVFPGNYEDYLWRKQGGQHVAPTLDDVPGAKAAKTGSSSATKPAASDSAHNEIAAPRTGGVTGGIGKRLNPIKRKQMEDRVYGLEGKSAQVGSRYCPLRNRPAEFRQRRPGHRDRRNSTCFEATAPS